MWSVNSLLYLPCLPLVACLQAGQLYVQAEQYERAAELFLCCREFALLDGVMGHAGSSDLWLRYAQAKEGVRAIVLVGCEGKAGWGSFAVPCPVPTAATYCRWLLADLGSFGDAARAYEQAGDCLAAIRVYLDRLRDAESAAELAQRMGSSQGCLTVARYCERAGKHQLALEQYCCGGSIDAAFLLAQRADCMPAFASWARGAGSAEAALLAAGHYKAQGQLALAGELCALAGKHERAARLYIQVGSGCCWRVLLLSHSNRPPCPQRLTGNTSPPCALACRSRAGWRRVAAGSHPACAAGAGSGCCCGGAGAPAGCGRHGGSPAGTAPVPGQPRAGLRGGGGAGAAGAGSWQLQGGQACLLACWRMGPP